MTEEEPPRVPGYARNDRTEARTAAIPHGSESTRKLRDIARRRREAEAKLEHHLLDAKQHTDE